MRAAREKTALVTGGTDGIGKEIARGLTNIGVHVLIVGRDPLKGERAASELRDRGSVEFIPCDLSLVANAKWLASQVANREIRLNYLVHSAGVLRAERILTSEGVESNLAVNYLIRFVLTQHLLPKLRLAAQPDDPARIIFIGGAAHIGTIDFEDPNLSKDFGLIRSLLQYQTLNDVYTAELGHRLAESHVEHPVTVNVIKYGVVETNIRRHAPLWLRLLAASLGPFLGQSAFQAANPALELMLDPQYRNVSAGMFSYIRKLKRIEPRAYVADRQVGARLWQLSYALSDGHFAAEPFPA